ncbi:unnamed protein product [Lathyrus oleraceus]|uniref:putative F-box/LRR-repeat protein 23 n=1 Tax=Pisum sativum TaxID=3888 RepID=UPI0021CEA170|nr:putative F-box/LRR-repeat protein 23 [Pisum sativum]
MASSCLSHVLEIEKLEISPKPNWLELPRDITINILQRLGTLDLVTSASVVCPLWWNICKDPLIWTTIDMMSNLSFSQNYFAYYSRLEKICLYAIDRSCGQLKNIHFYKFGTDGLLYNIAKRASNLRCIRLEECHEISNKAFSEVVKKQPLLEELVIHHCYDLGRFFFEYIGVCCPLIKSLKFFPCLIKECNKCDNIAFVIGRTMSELRHLTIFKNELSNDGLLAILDGCPSLESLDLRGCFHLDLDQSLLKRCKKQIRELRLPADSANHHLSNSNYNNYLHMKAIYRMEQFIKRF